MGFLVSIVRRRFLNLQKSHLEWQAQLIAQAISKAQNSINDLVRAGTDYSADTTIAKKLLYRQQKLQALENKLKQQKDAIDLQLQECKQELESCKSMIEEGVQTFFSYGGR